MGYPTVVQNDANGNPQTYLATVQGLIRGTNVVAYAEEIEGQTEEFTEEGQTVTRICYCRWADRQQFRTDMLGTTKFLAANAVGDGTTTTVTNLTRQPPEVHGEFSWLFAQECRLIEGVAPPTSNTTSLAQTLSSPASYPVSMRDPTTQSAIFALAKFAVVYKDLPYNVYADVPIPTYFPGGTPNVNGIGEMNRYITRMPRFTAQLLNLPGGNATNSLKMVGGNNNQIIPEGLKVTTTQEEFHYLWRQLPFIPDSVLDPQVNTVNSVPFDPDFNNDTRLSAHTVLFTGYTPERRYHTAAGDIAWDITLSFLYQPQGWNYFPRMDGNAGAQTILGTAQNGEFGFYLFSYDGTNRNKTPNNNLNMVYGESDLNKLFVFPATSPPIPP